MKEQKKIVSNWGNFPSIKAMVFSPDPSENIENWVKDAHPFIARGNGRCYNDASLNDHILDMRNHNKILDFDPENGILHCESGVLLNEIIRIFLPKGYFLFVSPGTKFVTIGGAIAANIHGKNHHQDGGFSNFLIEFKLLRKDGEIINCSMTENPEIFKATCGGMGLTGVILDAKIRLRPVSTAYIRQTSLKTNSLDETIEQINNSKSSTYSVAWIDCLAGGNQLGKGIILNGEHARFEELPEKLKSRPLYYPESGSINIPILFPGFILGKTAIQIFNSLYYWNQSKKGGERIVHFEPYFYPLDKLLNWNRIYGKKGFTQFQCVLPPEPAAVYLRKILNTVRDSGHGSFLSVLKLLKEDEHTGALNFPMEGFTLSLDFKWESGLAELLERLDQIVLEAGGRLYLAKDSRMSSTTFHKSYLQSESFQKKYLGEKPGLSSYLSKRLGLTD